MREIEQAFIDSSVVNEHNMLLPPGSSDYVGLDGPGPYTHTPTSQESLTRGAQRRSSRHDDEESKQSPQFADRLVQKDVDNYI